MLQWSAVSHLDTSRSEHSSGRTCWRGACGDRLAARHARCLTRLGAVLTYLATVAFAASLGRVQWLGVGQLRIHHRELRRVAVPDDQRSTVSGPRALSTAVVHQPRFCCRIPAVPFNYAFPCWCRLAPGAGDYSSLVSSRLNHPALVNRSRTD